MRGRCLHGNRFAVSLALPRDSGLLQNTGPQLGCTENCNDYSKLVSHRTSNSVSSGLTCLADGEHQEWQRNRLQLQRKQCFVGNHRHGFHGDVPLDAAQFVVTCNACHGTVNL